ncbi:MAG: YbaK/EbsC family protein [Rhizobiales bacterium]|nr:YbaK/EbsC family protein [Hyphomicrobiales bacterium]
MSIAPTLQKYLDQNVTYEIVAHEPTMSSMRTAQVCHIPGERLAKGIVLRGKDGYFLAVLPATNHIRLPDLRSQLGENVALAAEGEIDQLFRDCAHGAIPAIGECYGLDTIVDDDLNDKSDVYIEAGDHATLIHLDRAQFKKLTTDARHGHFSVHD